MEKGIYDTALDLLHERRKQIREMLFKQYKGEKPFRMEPVDDDTHIWILDNMAGEDIDYAVETYGRDAVNQWMMEVTNKKSKRVM